jgi:hypothetical protein
MKMMRLDDKNFCYHCGGLNNTVITSIDNGHISECKTYCSECGFKALWAYGFYNIESWHKVNENED